MSVPVFVSLVLLIFLGGRPVLIAGMSLRKNALLSLDPGLMAETLEFRSMSFDESPRFVRRRLHGYRKEALEAGFIELACFSRINMAEPNFCCVLVSPDRITIVELDYTGMPPVSLVYALLEQPAMLWKCLVGVHVTAMVTVFEGNRRLITTRQACLADSHQPEEKEFNIVAPQASFNEKYTAHREKVEALCAARKLEAKTFHTADEIYSYELTCLQELAKDQS